LRTIPIGMNAKLKISAVPRSKRSEALRFIAAGAVRDRTTADRRVQTLARVAEQYGDRNVALWWSRWGRVCVAASMLVERPGRTGMLFHSPAGLEGVDSDALEQLVREISRDALARGMTLVQALKRPDAKRDVAMLEAAGYELLARLVHMRLELGDLRPPDRDPGITWKTYAEFSEEKFGKLIGRTYEGTLDCPALAGMREIGDVIAGHKASGVFRPESWWIAYRDLRASGCILVNDSQDGLTCEIVYMGVAPEQRGCGLGKAMLQRASEHARKRERTAMTLSVDAANHYAIARYKSEGFREKYRRLACVMKRNER